MRQLESIEQVGIRPYEHDTGLIGLGRPLYAQPALLDVKALRMTRLYRQTRLTLAIRIVLLASAVIAALLGQWDTAVITAAIGAVTHLPAIISRRCQFTLPADFEFLAVLFVFGSLFLGEVRGYYTRFWWWDALLHTGAGFLLGILGFLLVYALNQRGLGNLQLRPVFIAFFSFTFSLALGVLWEIFEFGMDLVFELNMQKSGLVDTLWDLIVNVLGAAAIAILGYGWLRTSDGGSFLEQWIQRVTGLRD